MQALGFGKVTLAVHPQAVARSSFLPPRARQSGITMAGVNNNNNNGKNVRKGQQHSLLFRQLFEKESSTYTYLLADAGHPDRPAVVSWGSSQTHNSHINTDLTLGVITNL